MKALDRATAQQLWDELWWCGTRPQLRAVAARIRRDWAATPEQRAQNAGELAKLRQGYDLRWVTLVEPRGDATFGSGLRMPFPNR